MKGIVFNVLEAVIAREEGEDAWDDILVAADDDGSYTSLGSYPDGQLVGLIAVIADRRGANVNDTIRWFGRGALPLFAERYPALFAPHESTRPFVLTLNEIIHPEVRKLYPGADLPVFDFEQHASGALGMDYRSERKMCAFAEGLIEGSAAHFGETVAIEQPVCMLEGADHCRLEITFGG